MGQCYITRRGTKSSGAVEQLGIYPTGNDGRPIGNVTVLNNVSNLSKYPFIENNNVLSVALPNNLRWIADYCFQKCISLQNITIPDKVTSISQYCFDGCTQLSKVVLPKNLTIIKQYAFQNCSGLYDIVIPDDIESLEVCSYAFSGCQGLDNETITKLATKTLGTVYSYAFSNLKGITEVTTQCTYNNYFNNCTNLRKVTILKALSDGGFGSSVFSGCTNLTEVVLPDNATKISSSMFSGNSKLTTVNIPETTTKIESSAFYSTAINNIVFPDSLIEIGNNAFYNCINLSSVVVSENANYTLGQYAFQYSGVTDEGVKSILAHSGTIYPYIFDSCNSLVNIEVNRSWTNMFSNCANLKTAKIVNIKSSNTNMGSSVFYNDTSLEQVILGDGITTIGTAVFYNCTSLKTVYLTSSIATATSSSLTSTSSSYYVFYNCTALEDVQLGQDWNMSLRLNVSNNITVDSMVAMFNSLKDLTGETAKTLTLGSTNLGKLTDEQKAIAINKNWTLA